MPPLRAVAIAIGLALIILFLIAGLLISIATAISSGRQIWLARRRAKQDLHPDYVRELRAKAPPRRRPVFRHQHKPADVPESGKRRPVNSSGG